MAGGIGSRFWPQSRLSKPKQFLDILGVGKTLLQMTYERFLKICPKENIYIVTNEAYRELTQQQLPDIDDGQILGEPLRRNTGPCIAYISAKINALQDDANMVVAPSDHLIMNEDLFVDDIRKALDFVDKKDCLITLGIKPTRPDTGYGYIQYLENKGDKGVYKVKTFTEKPTYEIAKSFLESGDFLWNSGMFIWKVRNILKAFKKHLPEMYDIFMDGKKVYNTPEEKAFIKKSYALCTNISIDYAIMEKANNVSVIPSDFGWSDLGTWASLYEKYDKDYLGNAVSGKNVMIYDSSNCMVMVPENKLVVLEGLEDYIVVDAEDTLLICRKSNEQEIKQITTDIKRKLGDEFL